MALYSNVRLFCLYQKICCLLCFPCGSAGKESACNAGDLGLISGLGRSTGEGKGYLLTPLFWPGEFHGLYSPWGHKEVDMTERLNWTELIKDIYKKVVAKIILMIKDWVHSPWDQEQDFPGGPEVKNIPANEGDMGLSLAPAGFHMPLCLWWA